MDFSHGAISMCFEFLLSAKVMLLLALLIRDFDLSGREANLVQDKLVSFLFLGLLADFPMSPVEQKHCRTQHLTHHFSGCTLIK
jgi:hypothetical protein